MKIQFIILSIVISINYLFAKDQVYEVSPNKYTDEYVCFTNWIVHEDWNDGKAFKPTNENLLTKIISFHNKMDTMQIKTENYTSTLDYIQFLDLKKASYGLKKGTLGITYGFRMNSGEWIYQDIFEDGSLSD